MSSPLSQTPDGVCLAVRAMPRAGVNAIAGVREGRLVVKVTAAPEDGQANAALVKLLSKAWRFPASRIEVVSGAAAREKLLLLRGAVLADLPDL